ncbi:MAG: hypothetical protein M3S32_09535 [Acidobacteriota bacterium]|nr:hypothetical protein [Acidobacteriota bacterium]
MRHTTVFRLLAACVALTALASRARAADEPSRDLARQLQGWYEGVAGPGNHLKILIQPAGAGSDYSYAFDVTIQGRYEKTNVSIHGALQIEREGEAVRFRWETAKGRCDLPLRRAGDGFEGETLPGACLTAFQNPVPGKWRFEIEPGGNIRVRSVDSGETLRFRKTVAPPKRS